MAIAMTKRVYGYGPVRLRRGKVMKNTFVLTILGVILCALVFWLGGCGYVVKVDRFLDNAATDVAMIGSDEEFAQPGETEAQGRRRHIRNARINQQELMEDVDKTLLVDKPSKLTDKRVP